MNSNSKYRHSPLLLPPVNPALKAAESILDRQMGNVWEMFPPSLCNSNRLLARVQIEVVSVHCKFIPLRNVVQLSTFR